MSEKCDGCGKFMGETNPPVKQQELAVFDRRQEQWYPEVFMYCSKCTAPEEEPADVPKSG